MTHQKGIAICFVAASVSVAQRAAVPVTIRLVGWRGWDGGVGGGGETVNVRYALCFDSASVPDHLLAIYSDGRYR